MCALLLVFLSFALGHLLPQNVLYVVLLPLEKFYHLHQNFHPCFGLCSSEQAFILMFKEVFDNVKVSLQFFA